MNIIFKMTATEITIAYHALSSLADNEHDQGADEGTMAGMLESAIDVFASLDKIKSLEPTMVTMHVSVFSAMCAAVEIYCCDPVDDDPPEGEPTVVEQRAFYCRLERLTHMRAVQING